MSFYNELKSFLSNLQPDNSSDSKAPWPGEAAVAADAVEALMRAAQAAYTDQHGAAGSDHPDRGGVLLKLDKLDPFDGYSGKVHLHGAKDRHHAADRPVLLVKIAAGGKQTLVRQCGQLYVGQSNMDVGETRVSEELASRIGELCH